MSWDAMLEDELRICQEQGHCSTCVREHFEECCQCATNLENRSQP